VNRTRLRPVSDKRRAQNAAYKPIHDAVIERDVNCQAGQWGNNFVCFWPEVRCGGTLVVHHVISRARAPELALDPSNLITLCWAHHTAVHANVALATERGLLLSAPLGPKGMGE
jgi:5-methylcytosine-specific restriction endonuclease McrA